MTSLVAVPSPLDALSRPLASRVLLCRPVVCGAGPLQLRAAG
eukprot:CAMPEP_0172181934 /NCGR_PEP_ID=MMETSP1050-20130122/18108_1 /TAXON_ID=233186 /ORGANISM="Cryptomonas curvata, Strain CCAP979/52" /LENGTH=41 /DNA_ID= /DNA_START= /DNA_END= /DNA_ORIENTATION=